MILRGYINGWSLLQKIICGLTILYLLAPMVIIILLSFSSSQFLAFPPPGFSLQWYERIVQDQRWMDALYTSVIIMIPSAISATAIGTAAAVAVERGRLPFAGLISGALMMPIVVPYIITAAAIYGAFRSWGISGTYGGFLLAHVMLTIPYVFSITLASLKTVDATIESAALTLGATPTRVLFSITLPLIMPAIVSGLLFAAVSSFDELVVSMFISSPQLRPLAVQMWSNVQGDTDPTIAAIASAMFFLTLLLLLLDSLVNRRRDALVR
jgi:putative spermidine/putrescine transport system permease protein